MPTNRFTWRDWILFALGGVITATVSEALLAYFRPYGTLGFTAAFVLLCVVSFSVGLLLWGPWHSRTLAAVDDLVDR